MKFGTKEKARLNAQIGWIRKNIYGHYKHNRFGHTPMDHILLHVAAFKCIFCYLVECIALFLNFLKITIPLVEKVFESRKKKMEGREVELQLWNMCTCIHMM